MKIDSKAYSYILEKGSIANIKYEDVMNSCIDVRYTPSVNFGMPCNKERYFIERFGEITIYIDKMIGEHENLTIKLNKFLGIKHLILDGWKTI